MSTCKQWREGDEVVCTCGLRWAVGDSHPVRAIKTGIEQIKNLRERLANENGGFKG